MATMRSTSGASLELPIQVSLSEDERARLLSTWKFYTHDLVLPGGEPLNEGIVLGEQHVDEDGDDSAEEDRGGCSCGAEGRVCSRDVDADGRGCECVEDYLGGRLVSSPKGQFFVDPKPGLDRGPARPVLSLPHPSHLPLVECGAACRCASSPTSMCQNRLTQTVSLLESPLLLRSSPTDPALGLGLITTRPLPAGSFICTYAGEVISTPEARRRWIYQEKEGLGNYIFALKTTGGRVNIDPRVIGGVGRFLNHSHAPNLVPHLIFRTPTHLTVPRIAFFASRDIDAGEELTWDYGDGAVDNQDDSSTAESSTARRVSCGCGAEACSGWMPFDAAL